MANRDGGPAFPMASDDLRTLGMSPRAYLAGWAMAGLLAQTPTAERASVFASEAVKCADALLAELNKEADDGES